MSTTFRVACGLMLLSAGAGLADGPQILENEGRVGSYVLGGRLVYPSRDRGIQVKTDDRGVIREITVFVPGMFTQRFVTIGQSSLKEVLERYGKAERTQREGDWMVFEYGFKRHLVAFGFDNTPGNREPPAQRRVVFVSLRR